MKVKEIMTRAIDVVSPETTLRDAAERMQSLDVGVLPVCDQERLVGVITDRDITIRATADGLDPFATQVGEVMSRDGLITCLMDDDVEAATQKMRDKQVRRLPVLDQDQRLVGILALADVAVDQEDARVSSETFKAVSRPSCASLVVGPRRLTPVVPEGPRSCYDAVVDIEPIRGRRMIAIIDYGMGNLRSVQKAIEAVGSSAVITGDPDRIRIASKVILPGVGAFADAMAELQRTGLGDAFREAVAAGKTCLGICLGLQLLFERSLEDGDHKGLGLLPGRVIRFASRPGLKVPHMGWNTLRIRRPCPILGGLEEAPSVYFVHSYHAETSDDSIVAAESDYPVPFPAVVWRDNLMACQFHPEKSQQVGLAMYSRFVGL